MQKLLIIVLVPLILGGYDCKIEKNVNDFSDDDETCSGKMSSWMDSGIGFMQGTMESIFSKSGNKDEEPKFLCFSRHNKDEPYYVTIANFSSWAMEDNHFDTMIKSIFIIHGFKDINTPWTKILKNALLLRENCNVFILEYGQPHDTWSEAFNKVPEVGKLVAVFIGKLTNSMGLDPAKVHIIGHSAGAQIAGFVGKEFKRTEKRRIGRITGLDPAGPGFYDAEPDQRLDATDASFVDVIHTDKGCNRLEGLGYPGAIGHFDFYPNGGKFHPGCLEPKKYLRQQNVSLSKVMFKYLFGTIGEFEHQVLNFAFCKHVRSKDFFIASILAESCNFESVQCSGWNRYLSGQCDDNDKVFMGYYADKYKDLADDGIHKKFYLKTTAESPYCI